jgi:hypothetical protein
MSGALARDFEPGFKVAHFIKSYGSHWRMMKPRTVNASGDLERWR